MTDLALSYTISPSNDSTLAIEVSKTGLRRRPQKRTLVLDKFQGELTFARNDPTTFRLTLTIDPQSIGCCDAHLSAKKRRKVAAFARAALTTNSHPQITFTSTSLCPKPIRGFVIDGVLQVRGITRVVKMSAVLNPVRKDWLQLDGDATFRLTDFDLPRPSSFFGLFGTKDEVVVRLLLWPAPAS
jgi:polyisoprenoid-binding protein YceI